MRQTSRGKFNRLQRTTAESKTSTLDEYGLRCHQPARPPPYASYPVLVHRLASLLHPSFKPRLTTSPLRFANPSPPSGRVEDLHLQAVKHARHTENSPGRQSWVVGYPFEISPEGTAEPTSRRVSLTSQTTQRSLTREGRFSRPCRDWRASLTYPALACWATFSRPGIAGTETYALKLRNCEA